MRAHDSLTLDSQSERMSAVMRRRNGNGTLTVDGVSYRGLLTAGWFGVREKHYSRLKIYDRLRTSEQPVCLKTVALNARDI